MSETVIAPRPPNDGNEWGCQCARCGSSMTREDCWACGGEGFVDRSDEDPLWYDEDDLYPCPTCGGKGGWLVCLSQIGDEEPSWCEAHPMPGREGQAAGPEWFILPARGARGGGDPR